MSVFEALRAIVWDWGVRCFGIDHMIDRKVRALRIVEEAIELAQCAGVEKEKLHKLVDMVYERPVGEYWQELGGVLVTTSVFCNSMGFGVEEIFRHEVQRCLSKSPEHFAERNKQKVDGGLD